MHLQDCNSYTVPGLISTLVHMSTLVRNYLNSHEQPTANIDFLRDHSHGSLPTTAAHISGSYKGATNYQVSYGYWPLVALLFSSYSYTNALKLALALPLTFTLTAGCLILNLWSSSHSCIRKTCEHEWYMTIYNYLLANQHSQQRDAQVSN